MIQSGIIDSLTMDIKKTANSFLIFVIRRIIEIFGILIAILGILLFISLISYSPKIQILFFPKVQK